MLDLAKLDILAGSEEGRWFHPLHPRTRAVILDSKGETWGFKLMGRHAAVVRAALKTLNDERAAIEAQGRTVSEAEALRLNAEFLARCIKSWTPMTLDGQELVFSFDNAVKLLLDARFRWLEPQLRNFIMDDGGFFPA